jgi:hypothetical protein
VSPPLGKHLRQHEPGQEHWSRKIDADHLPNPAGIELVVGIGDGTGGVVHQDVDAPKGLVGGTYDGGQRGVLPEIAFDANAPTAGSLHEAECVLEVRERARCQHKIHPLLREGLGDRNADAPGRAGHDGRAAGELIQPRTHPGPVAHRQSA